MPGVVKSPRDEELWSKAKLCAEEQGHKEEWPYVMGIFQRMKGEKKASYLNPKTLSFLYLISNGA